MTRRLLAASAAASLVAAVLSWTSAAEAAPSGADGSDAIQQFGSCLAAGGRGDLLLVLDTSGSLKTTDPDAQRVTAAKYLVDELADYVGRSKDISLDIAVAGFDVGFAPTTSWTALTPSSQGSVDSALDAYRGRDTGWETDYWSAATGARKYLAAKAGSSTTDCQAWVWFSDGKDEVDTRTTKADQDSYGTSKPFAPGVDLTAPGSGERATALAEKDLCRSGGVADSLRFQGVTTLAIGLASTGTPASDFGLMKGIATGSGQCGSRSARHLGDFMLAGDVDQLLLAFDKYADPSVAPSTTTTGLCSGSVCPQGTHEFILDKSIDQVHILGTASATAYHAVLIDPKNRQYQLVPGQPLPSIAGVDLTGRWDTGKTFELTMKDTGPTWTGPWRLVFVADQGGSGALAQTNIRLYGDVRPAWTDQKPSMPAGGSTAITTGMQDSSGDAIPSVLGNADLRIELRPASGSPVDVAPVSGRSVAGTESLDLSSVSPGPATLVMTLAVTTKGAGGHPGTALEPVVRSYPVTVTPPPSYPTLPATVAFGSGSTTDPVTVDLPLSGAPGCAWLQTSDVAVLPDGVRRATLTSTSSQSAPATGSLPVTLTIDSVGNGLAGGSLTVATQPQGCTGKVVPVTVRFSYEVEQPRNDRLFVGVFIAVIVGGVLLPIAMLYLMKWRTAKVPGSSLAVASVSGQLTEASSFLAGMNLGHENTRVIPLAGGDRRTVVLSPRITVRTRMGWGLTEPGYSSIEPGPVVTSTGGAKLPLAVQDRWIAALDPVDPHHGDVELLFILSASLAKLPELVADARNRAPELVARLRAGLGPAPAPPPPPPGGDSGWGTAGESSTSAPQRPPGPQQPSSGGYDQW